MRIGVVLERQREQSVHRISCKSHRHDTHQHKANGHGVGFPPTVFGDAYDFDSFSDMFHTEPKLGSSRL
jgi:hypothetical protein